MRWPWRRRATRTAARPAPGSGQPDRNGTPDPPVVVLGFQDGSRFTLGGESVRAFVEVAEQLSSPGQ
jgi:hypothetical protein